MLNIMAFADDFGAVIPVIMAIMFAIFGVIAKAADNAKKRTEETTKPSPRTAAAHAAQKAAPRPAPATAKHREMRPTIKSIFDEPDGHKHGGGDLVEEVQPIVGSLGEVNDEGCSELAGVRFLTKTNEDEGEDDIPAFDYNAIAAAIVFGSVLSDPKG